MPHLTIATSSGIVWLTLVTHFGAALLALAAGTIALAVAKGGRLHKQSGIVFTWAIITTGILAKALGNFIFVAVLEILMTPLFIMFYKLRALGPAWQLIPVAILRFC